MKCSFYRNSSPWYILSKCNGLDRSIIRRSDIISFLRNCFFHDLLLLCYFPHTDFPFTIFFWIIFAKFDWRVINSTEQSGPVCNIRMYYIINNHEGAVSKVTKNFFTRKFFISSWTLCPSFTRRKIFVQRIFEIFQTCVSKIRSYLLLENAISSVAPSPWQHGRFGVYIFRNLWLLTFYVGLANRLT